MSATTTLIIRDAATHGGVDFRRWDIAGVADVAAGTSISLNVLMTVSGATAAALPDTLTLTVVNDAGSAVRAFTLTPSSASQTVTFFHTSDGTAAGGPRCGTVEVALRATNTTGGPAGTYDVATGGTPNTPPTAKETVLARGWDRASTTAVQVLSNVGLGVGVSTTTPDSATTPHTASLKGTVLPTLVASPWAGFGSALAFDGVNRGTASQGVDCGNSVTGVPGVSGVGAAAAFCLEAKVKTGASLATMIVASRWGATGPTQQILLYTDGVHWLVAVVDNGSVQRFLTGASLLTVNTLYDVAATYDGTTLRLFANGVLDGSMALSGMQAPDAVTSFLVGTYADPAVFPWLGIIDEVRWSKTVRYTAAYTPAAAPFGADVNALGLWHLDSVTTVPLPTPFAFGDSVFVRTTLGATPYVSASLTNIAGPLAAAVSSASNIFDSTFAGGAPYSSGVNNAFPASSGVQATDVTIGNANISGQPWTVFTGKSTDSATVDPWLAVSHYMQLDDNVYKTPPDGTTDVTHNVASRLNANIGFVACRLTNARGLGINAVTWLHSLRDVGGLAADQDTTSQTTGLAGGASGWDTAFFSWTGQLPSGGYTSKRTVTAPAGALGLIVGGGSTGSATLTLLAPNPAFRLVLGAGPNEGLKPGSDKDHWHPGDPLLISVALIDMTLAQPLMPDATPAPTVIVMRFNQALNRSEFYAANGVWKPTLAATLDSWPLTPAAGDARTFTRSFTGAVTAGWGVTDLLLVGLAFVNGTPYSAPLAMAAVGLPNGHGGWVFDGGGFIGFPSK